MSIPYVGIYRYFIDFTLKNEPYSKVHCNLQL